MPTCPPVCQAVSAALQRSPGCVSPEQTRLWWAAGRHEEPTATPSPTRISVPPDLHPLWSQPAVLSGGGQRGTHVHQPWLCRSRLTSPPAPSAQAEDPMPCSTRRRDARAGGCCRPSCQRQVPEQQTVSPPLQPGTSTGGCTHRAGRSQWLQEQGPRLRVFLPPGSAGGSGPRNTGEAATASAVPCQP